MLVSPSFSSPNIRLALYLYSFPLVQAADRALLVDLLPPSKQETGNAWAGRMFGLGSVAGFFVFVKRLYLHTHDS